jgi:hypothetical protein
MKKMKTTTRLMIGIVAIATVLAIAFSGVALASQPVCPPPETDKIRTVTMINCQGMVTETEQVSWETSNEDLINNPPLGIDILGIIPIPVGEVVGKLDYNQDLKVTDGVTNYIKDMDVDTGSEPNLNVMKSIGYAQGETIGSLSHDEEVDMEIIAVASLTRRVILCPFAAPATETPVFRPGGRLTLPVLPPSCEDVSAGSSMTVTDVLATTRTKVEMSESPVSLHYGITATGSGGAGTSAHGHIAADFSAEVEDGALFSSILFDIFEPPLGSKLTYYEKSSANGEWEFSKEMGYESRIRP